MRILKRTAQFVKNFYIYNKSLIISNFIKRLAGLKLHAVPFKNGKNIKLLLAFAQNMRILNKEAHIRGKSILRPILCLTWKNQKRGQYL